MYQLFFWTFIIGIIGLSVILIISPDVSTWKQRLIVFPLVAFFMGISATGLVCSLSVWSQ